jgi:Rrf2 family transcriptional regulator, iron-sulfur cluster assembly transcription factor
MISRTARYAFHILGFLAARPTQRLRGEEIAAATGIPVNYLAKILNQLRKAGLVESQKGWGGGFQLHAGAEKRPIRDVLVVFDGLGSAERTDCALGRPACDAEHPCAMHDEWANVRDGFTRMIRTTRVADLAG